MASTGMSVVVVTAGTMVLVAMAMVLVTMVMVVFMVFVLTAAMFVLVVLMMMFMSAAMVVFVLMFVFVTVAGHFLILLHMGNSGAKNCADMGIVKGIIHLFSLAAAFNKSCGFKNRKLVGNCALAHSKNIADTANAHFAFRKSRKNSYSCFIAEKFKNLGGFFKNFFRRHICFCLFNYMGVFGVNIRQANRSFHQNMNI